MNPLDARESNETYEYPARPYTLPMRPVQTFRVLSESGDVPTAQTWEPRQHRSPDDPDYDWKTDGYIAAENRQIQEMVSSAQTPEIDEAVFNEDPWESANTTSVFAGPDPWSDKYLTAEDARVLRQDGRGTQDVFTDDLVRVI